LVEATNKEERMKPGDHVWVRVLGRTHLAKIEKIDRKVHIVFTNGTRPVINGHRKQRVALLKEQFVPHNKSNIEWIVGGLK
jgi:hypothetical protein